jgi:AraC-like DNA-binding protein
MATPSSAGHPDHRAHLTGRHAPTPPIHRYPPSPNLAGLIRSFWIPEWDLPDGVTQVQRVLQYPVCLIVVSNEYARLYGVSTGLSQVELAGTGWAAGVMLQPAAGWLIWNQSVSTLTDRHVPLESVPTFDGARLTDRIRAIMEQGSAGTHPHLEVTATYQQALLHLARIDEEGSMVNTLVERVESDRTLVRVEQLAEAAAMSERALQRLTRHRLGLTPKWLIQRRRLHDAVEHLKTGQLSLAALAHDLGYTDQAHFTRDFSRATGTTPGAYLAAQTSQ